MADYLVLEEDGTSHLDLEESTDSLVLEDGTQLAVKTGVGLAGTIGNSVSPTAQPSYAVWKVGTITVPSSTGSQSITGLGGTPAAVFFFGTNWLTEDSKVAASGHGMFRGMAAPKWDAPGTIVQNAACVIPTGNAHSQENVAIDMLNTSGGLTWLYVAGLTSFDADGFTLNWTTAASGGYKVVYAALFDVEHVGGYVGTSTTLGLGWKAGASLLHGAWEGPVGNAAADRTQEFYGGAAYPGLGSTDWLAAGLTAYTFPTSASAQYNTRVDANAPGTVICQSGSFIGPFLSTQNVTAVPSGAGLTDYAVSTHLADNSIMVVAWDDDDPTAGGFTMPSATSATHTESGMTFPPGLVVGYTISDEPDGQGTGGRGAAGFSVITPDFQWCCVSDNGQAYQSFQRGICDVVDAGGVHTATVELTTDGFVVTVDDDDVSPNTWVWQAFGHPQRVAVWIPQSYRKAN